MPRQIDLFSQNLKVTNDPNNQISVTAAQINHLNDQIPAALAAAEAAFINSVLTAIDKATGLDLVDWLAEAEQFFNWISAVLQQSWLSFQQLINSVVGGIDKDVTDLITALLDSASNASAAQGAWITVFEDLGFSVTDATTYVVWLQSLETDIGLALEGNITPLLTLLFGSNTTPSLPGSISAPTVTNTPQAAQPVSNFPNAASMVAGGGWSWDGTITYTDPVTGVTSPGSAKFTAPGTLHLNGVVAPVQAGQVVTLAAQVQWSGLTTSGSNPIQLQLVPWSGTTSPQTAGTPVVVAEIASPTVSAGWNSISGTYTVPGSGVGFVQMRLVVTANALTGNVWWTNCTDAISGGYLATLRADATQLQNDSVAAQAATQTFLTAIQTAVTTFESDDNWTELATSVGTAYQTWVSAESALAEDEFATLQQMLNAFLGIDPNSGLMSPTNVQGVGGFQTLEDTFISTYNQLGAALGGDVADSGGLAWLAQLMNDIGVNSSSPLWPFISTAQSNNQTLAIVNNQPVSAGLEATVESNGPYQSAVALSGDLVAKTTSRGTFVTMSQAKTLGFVQWIGGYTVAVTGFKINFYRMDSGGNLDWLFTSADLAATLSSSPIWNVYDLATPITVNAGDVIGVEFQIITSGSVDAYGYVSPVAGNHPSAAIKQPGFSQNWAGGAASTIASGSIGWSTAAPYVGLGVGTVPPTPFFPKTNPFTTSTTYTIQSWDVYVDLIALSGGGGGEGETGLGNGPGGVGGTWATRTLTVGTSGPAGIIAGGTITVIVGAGGAGGPFFTPGSPGTATTFSWLDASSATQTLTAPGGAGGSAATNLTSWGLAPSPNPLTFEGNSYFGGATNTLGGVGAAPGAGGTGGAAFQFGFAGAGGQAWIVDRQT